MGKYALFAPAEIADDPPVVRALWRDAAEFAGYEPAGEPTSELVTELPVFAEHFGRSPRTFLRIEGPVS